MNYEELLSQMQGLAKEMGDLTKNQQKSYKSLCKNMESGDLKNLAKDIAALKALCESYESTLLTMQEVSEGFDSKAYIESGEFAEQMLLCCQKTGVDVKGEFPLYEMFPYKVKVDVENLDMYIDKKRVQCLRPVSFINGIKAEQDKLLKAPFNPTVFASELAQAYDLTLMKQNAGKVYAKDSDCYLTNIYKSLTPMRRFKKDYDQQSFAFDLARLYSVENKQTDDGRKLQFGPSREIKQAIRILDSYGEEQYLATIRFYK